MTSRVYLVRHGQSEWNVLRLTQGQTMHPKLTELGREQAAAAAELIAADLGLHSAGVQVLSSDLVRAAQSAEILASRLSGVIESEPRLREQCLGELEGKGYEETWAAAENFDWSDPSQPIAGGESLMAVYDRMAAVIEELRASAERCEVTVLVSHGDAIRAAVAYLAGLLPNQAEWVDVPNGAVARIDGSITWLSDASR